MTTQLGIEKTSAVWILQRELIRRCEKNPHYSLRAFAQTLGLSHSFISLVLANKRPLSKKSALKVSEKLALSLSDRAQLLGQPLENQSETPEADRLQIGLDTFTLISQWQHYAILSLSEVKGFRLNATWIAKKLGIGELQAKLAVQCLLRLGLLEKRNGRWQQSGLPIKVENHVSTAATRKFQRQLLEKALESLDNDPIEVRDFSSMTMSINPAHVDYARARIQKFRRELCQELEGKGDPSTVYNLTVQIYPVSKNFSKNYGKKRQ